MAPRVTIRQANEIRKLLSNEKLTIRQKLTGVASVLAAAGYTVLLPIDAIPDAIPFIGTADDAGAWLAAVGVVIKILLDRWTRVRESVAAMNEDMGQMKYALRMMYYREYGHDPTPQELEWFISQQQPE